MATSLVDAFLDSDAGRPFAPIRKDAHDILEAFLEAAGRTPDRLDAASVDAALQSVIPRMKKQRLPDAAPLVSAFIGFAGARAGLPGAEPLAEKARARAAELASEDAQRRKPVRVEGTVVGRNDPCPCGSGKKHKKCCGA